MFFKKDTQKDKPQHLRTGELGEQIAERFLKKQGWKILKRNWRKTYGEIDIVARDPAGALVCVEVKTARENKTGLTPEDYLRPAKRKKLARAAQGFVASHSNLVNDDAGWRIDVVAITIPGRVSRSNIKEFEQKAKIAHYKNM